MRTSYILMIVLTLCTSCRKFVEVPVPATQVDTRTAFSNNASAAALLTGIYSQMSLQTTLIGGAGGISAVTGLTADEFKPSANTADITRQAYANRLLATNPPQFWTSAYQYIYTANAAIEGLNGPNGVSAPVKQQLLGEAKFIRGFLYFYLVNLYGDVPLILSTDYQQNAVATRTSAATVWSQLIKDLTEAESQLNDQYLGSDAKTPSGEHTRPCKSAAAALLARVYLYQQKWSEAEQQATLVIANSTYQLTGLDDVFLANSAEAIWQLQPVVSGQNTYDGVAFILNAAPDFTAPGSLNPVLLARFEAPDQRPAHWISSVNDNGATYYFPYKYKVKFNPAVTEYQMILRLAEQYLIRAEARTRQGNTGGAQSDLNAIRSRAGLPGTTAATQTILLAAISHERETELFTEGDRWLDLKRSGTLDAVMQSVAPAKGTTWDPQYALYPIPLATAIQRDPNLKQNPGY